jgi:hypothetical protein
MNENLQKYNKASEELPEPQFYRLDEKTRDHIIDYMLHQCTSENGIDWVTMARVSPPAIWHLIPTVAKQLCRSDQEIQQALVITLQNRINALKFAEDAINKKDHPTRPVCHEVSQITGPLLSLMAQKIWEGHDKCPTDEKGMPMQFVYWGPTFRIKLF